MEYASFGHALERCRFHFLSRYAHARRALVLGDGDGRFTARLLAANPALTVDAVDASAAMLTQLRRRVAHISPQASERLTATHADLRLYTPQQAATPGRAAYGLVVSHFFLDCLTGDEVDQLIQRLVPHLTPHATLAVSEFAIPERGWMRPLSRAVVCSLYFAFFCLTGLRVHRIPEYGTILKRHGFRRVSHAQFLKGLLVTEIWRRGDM